MRIIGGKFKGKKILEPRDKETRPLKDLAKESIFNIINHSNKFSINLEDSYVLDLFSGTGSFGLECLSRQAKHVTFVENYKKILPILKKNLFNLKNLINNSIFSDEKRSTIGVASCDIDQDGIEETYFLNTDFVSGSLSKAS